MESKLQYFVLLQNKKAPKLMTTSAICYYLLKLTFFEIENVFFPVFVVTFTDARGNYHICP